MTIVSKDCEGTPLQPEDLCVVVQEQRLFLRGSPNRESVVLRPGTKCTFLFSEGQGVGRFEVEGLYKTATFFSCRVRKRRPPMSSWDRVRSIVKLDNRNRQKESQV